MLRFDKLKNYLCVKMSFEFLKTFYKNMKNNAAMSG